MSDLQAPLLEVRVITTDEEPEVRQPLEISGWGDCGRDTGIIGRVCQLVIIKDDKPQVCIDVRPDGSLCFTDMGSLYFEIDVPRQLSIRPARPWPVVPSEADDGH